MKVLAGLISVLLFWPGPSAAVSDPDSLCAPLLKFAASIGPDEKREIVFRTSWGGNFKDDPSPVLYAKRCEYDGYSKAKAVCDALMTDGAVEFSNNNAMRAIVCLAPKTRFSETSFEHGEFSLNYGSDDRGASITVQFDEDAKVGGMALRITANGY